MTSSADEADAARRRAVGQVIEAIVELSRQLQTPPVTPFARADLTRTQLEALFLLSHRSNLTPGHLATLLRVTRGAVTQLVAPLRELDLVDAVPHPQDARSVILTLTPEARQEVAAFEDAFITAALPRFHALSNHHLDHLALLLTTALEDS